jgi:EAL domain-containing protein (putative c-di-GMP-specific phosphodiesterase class I)
MAAREGRRDGAPRVCLYRPEVPLQAERERDPLRALRQTLDLGGLHLHYQPIVDVSVGRVRAVECLARWEHKDLGPIAPATFIALAERNGEIERLGEWVLVRALNETNPFISRGAPTLAINVSATQIMAAGFLPHLERCLAQNELPPNTLELELTESALAGNVETLRDLLVAIRRLKVRIAVDDFGTGYSSLSYLSRLPIDLIKVDRVFVRDFAKGGKTIIKAALTIARDFGQEVIIEGVETEEMLEQVRELGVSLIQGFWFAKPMAPEEIAIWIRNFEQRAAEVRNVSPS